ncbi:MAG: bifunctional phosphoribosylaminoimidazolecarboxamide formyltransferase/IMP cyclohydrolase [Candidatus Margulisiibacteriota bacterium]
MRALISVSDKTGIVDFSKALIELGYTIISTGGTHGLLAKEGLPVTAIDEVTAFPEMLDGRVKTLHPKIHGGLLALRDNAQHMATCQAHGIEMIDLVVVNLYPFEKTIQKPDVSLEEAIENIDIGGPSMLRSASKNYRSVGVIVNPDRYDAVIEELRQNEGELTAKTKWNLAKEAFQHTSRYDSLIAAYFEQHSEPEDTRFPQTLTPVLSKVSDLRYGENPHQAAAFYALKGQQGLPKLRQVQGKELSYNNLIDIEAAWQIARSFEKPGATVIKHTNPCGSAIGETLAQAYQKAHDADPVSAFGSIIGLNREVDATTAEAICKTFVEVVVAPSFSAQALSLLSAKPALRVIVLDDFFAADPAFSYRYVTGGFLVQQPDTKTITESDLTCVTTAQPSAEQIEDLVFAFALVKHVKSNAILVAKSGQSLGVGAGQMSRVESVEIALKKAGALASGAVMASDAFFPFKDSVVLGHQAGITAFIHPGGSKRDQESIDYCNEHGLVMVTTGVRHFKH